MFAGYRVHWGLILALVTAVVVWFLLWKTTLGFEIRTTGLNREAADTPASTSGRTIILTMALSGMLAGLAGAVEVTGLYYRHDVSYALGYGFDAIAIALLGRNQPSGWYSPRSCSAPCAAARPACSS